MNKLNEKDAIAILKDAGAFREKREDRFGDTKTGWWVDGVFLAKDAVDAVRQMRGEW